VDFNSDIFVSTGLSTYGLVIRLERTTDVMMANVAVLQEKSQPGAIILEIQSTKLRPDS